MKKLIKQLLPALMGMTAVGCSSVEQQQTNSQQFSEKQLAFQRMISDQENAQIDTFKQKQINKSSLKINASIDALTAINADIKSLRAEKNAKKKEILAAAKKLVRAEKKKMSGITFQDEYWKFVEEGKTLEANKPASKCKLNPANWFATSDDSEDSKQTDFTADEYEIAIRINKENQKASSESYENMKSILVSNTKAIVDQCKKELAAIDKEIADAQAVADKKSEKAHKSIQFEEELITYYKGLKASTVSQETITE